MNSPGTGVPPLNRLLTIAAIAVIGLATPGTVHTTENPITLKGRLGTYIYSFEKFNPDASSEHLTLSYESINLSATNIGTSALSFHSYLRTLNNPDDDDQNSPSTKIYNLYLQLDDLVWDGSVRLGRQFLYSGVARGKMDGIKVELAPHRDVAVTGFLGTQEPDDLSTKVDSWSSSNTWGGRVRVDHIPDTQIGWSYNQRSRNDEEEARLTGIDVRNRSISPLDIYGKFDWDLVAKRPSYLVVKASARIGPRLSLSGEFAHHNPQIRSNSILSVFRQKSYNQVRFRPYFQLTERLGLEGGYATVRYSEDSTHRLEGGVTFGRGSAGFIYRTGYGGTTGGGYGSLNLNPRECLLVRLYANFQKHRTVEETSPLLESFVTSATFDSSKFDPLTLYLEVQEAWNPVLESDFRLFLRVNYRFRIGK
jgi:hypothetical protein